MGTADVEALRKYTEYMDGFASIKFMDTPLEEMQPLARPNPQEVIRKAADAVRELSVVINR